MKLHKTKELLNHLTGLSGNYITWAITTAYIETSEGEQPFIKVNLDITNINDIQLTYKMEEYCETNNPTEHVDVLDAKIYHKLLSWSLTSLRAKDILNIR